MKSFSFPKEARILNSYDFVKVNRSGKRLHTKHFILIYKANERGVTRLGVTVSKKIGNAVIRNRVKRLLREIFRLNRSFFPDGYDIIIAVKEKKAGRLDYWQTKREIETALDNKIYL